MTDIAWLANSADDNLMIYVLDFPRKQTDISCKLTP